MEPIMVDVGHDTKHYPYPYNLIILGVKLIASIGCIILAQLAERLNDYKNLHIPPIVIELFQILAYTAPVFMAVITVKKYLDDKKKSG